MKPTQPFPTKPSLWTYLYPARTTPWMSFGFLMVAFFNGIAESTLPFFVEKILTAIRANDIHLLKITLIILSIFGITTFITGWLWHRYFGWILLVQWNATIQSRILSWYRLISYDSALRYGITRLYSIIHKGSEEWTNFSYFLINRVTSAIISLSVSIILLMLILPGIWGLGAMFILIVFAFLAKSLHAYIQPIREKRRELANDMKNITLRSFLVPSLLLKRKSLIDTQSQILSLGEQIHILKKKEGIGAFVMFDLIYGLSNILRIILVVSVLYSWGILHDPIVQLPVVFLILAQLSFSINWFMDIAWEYGGIKTEVDKMLEAFASLPLAPNLDHGDEYKPGNGTIEFKNVSFGYNENKLNLEGVSLKIAGGEHIALVGPSGAGKTTIVRLVMAYLLPTSGSVLLDKQDTKSLDLASIIDYIGYLQQEPQIFDASIRDNLTYGIDREVTNEDIERALRDAAADFVLDDLSEGVDTIIGEKGLLLSGGERQRIAIAKLFLQSPSIIILDEPTAALDSISEAKVTEAIHRLSKGRTIITIAHRLQTVREADRIIVVRHGKIEAIGSHNELLNTSDLYKSMVDLQTGRVKEIED
ncbi:MAG: ABC transporter ATP-binding protein [Candidatus Gracilibacteria bacterium]